MSYRARRTFTVLAVLSSWALVLAAAGPASARVPGTTADEQGCVVCPAPPAERPTETTPAPARRQRTVGVELQALMGFADFTGGLGGVAQPGAAYGGQVAVSFHRFVAGLLRYEGSLHDVKGLRGVDGRLAVNGVTALMRLGLPALPWLNVYLQAGIGALHVSIPGDMLGSFFQDGWGAQIPLGGGLEFLVTRWLGLGVDTAYHFLVSREFEPQVSNRTRGTDLWATNGTVTFHF